MGATRSAGPLTVSAIVPCYNAADTLRECLQALEGQTRGLTEVIVVDDASTDASPEICSDFDCELIRMDPNAGPSAARNAGIEAARGDVLFFVDSDVALHPKAVEHATLLLEARPGLDIVHGTYDPEPLRGRGAVERYLVLREAYWRHHHAGLVNVVVFALAAIRPAVFKRFGPLDERLRDCEDVEYSTRMGGRASILISEQVTGSHDAGSSLYRALATQWKRSIPLPRLNAAGTARLERINRLRSLIATALALTMLPAALLYPPIVLASAAALGFALVSDAGLIKFFRRHRSRSSTALLSLIHLCFLAVLACGIAAGMPRARRDRLAPDPTWSSDYATH